MVKTPETLTAAKRAEQLNIGQPSSPRNATAAVGPADKPKKARYEDIARKSLLGTPPPLNAMGTMSPTDVVDGSVSNLAITDIERYEYDPRIRENPCYDDIITSIRANGILNQISVTKRPGSTKYTPYGGGNTRLRIARELYEEGDQRFARLTVIVKVWKGDATTIAAHLVENEQRGEISFWEKAQGVLSFKSNFEKEKGSSLSASDLNRELKASGLNYGLRMLQNFMFAAEYLAPIGPWLKSREVNSSIRPVLAAVLDLASKLSQLPAAEKSMQGVLHQQAALLSAQPDRADTTDGERESAAFDTAALLAQIMEAIGEAVGYSHAKLSAMARAVEVNPRIELDTLLLVDAATPVSSPSVTKISAPTPAPQSVQLPLGRMLSTVPVSGTPAKTSKALTGRRAAPTAVMPELPSATVVGSGVSKDRERDPQASYVSDLQPLFETLGEIQSLVDLSDLIYTAEHPYLMFGLYLDLPKGGIGQVDGVPVLDEQVPYRLSIWKLLVSLTGQLDRRCSEALPHTSAGETILWRQLFEQGEAAFHHTANQLLGEPFESVELSSITILFSHPELGFLMTRLFSQMEQLRVTHQERQLDGFVPLFAPREAS